MQVEIRDLVQGYGRRRVLDGVSFSLEPGITALLGANGAGKSTLMRTVVTDLPPRAGTILCDGEPVTSGPARRRAREHIGYLPQDFGYDSRWSVTEYVTYLAWLRAVPRRRRAEAVSLAVESVRLTPEARTRMGRLSGGMRQRAGIAGALVGEPDLLVLDEPTVGLDPSQRAGFRQLVASLPTSRILLSTHLTDDVEAIAGHVLILDQGAVRFHGPRPELTARYGSVESAYLELVTQPETERGA